MRNYWLTGEPRDGSDQQWQSYGSHPASTAVMRWRSDSIDFAALFNGRGRVSHEDIVRELEQAIGMLK